MENERKVIDNFDNLQIDEKYIDEVFNGQPTLKYADYMPHFSEGKSYNELSNIHRALWSRDLERQYRNIKRQRKDICDLTEKYENEQIDKSEIPNEMLEKYKSKTRYEIQMELGQ